MAVAVVSVEFTSYGSSCRGRSPRPDAVVPNPNTVQSLIRILTGYFSQQMRSSYESIFLVYLILRDRSLRIVQANSECRLPCVAAGKHSFNDTSMKRG